MRDDIRAELIKQFPADVVEVTQQDGIKYYACPTCKRAGCAWGGASADFCGQVLSWEQIGARRKKRTVGVKTATLTFEVAGDFTAETAAKCPLSYIAKLNADSVYQCPLNMRANCTLEIS